MRHDVIHFVTCLRRSLCAVVSVAILSVGLSVPGVLGQIDRANAQGAGDLIVTPTRVVFEGRTRAAQLGLVNRGSETATFRISVINMKMGENGELTEIARPEEGQQFAESLFRYSPRQVTLEPGASQAIRILLRKPADLAAGEYRSHMMMRGIPNVQSQSIENLQTGSASVQLIPVFGIAVPVIIRHGDLAYDIKIDGTEFIPASSEEPLDRVRFQLQRTGNRSAFGDLTVSVVHNGEQVVLAQTLRLAVYTPNTSRTVEMNLRVPDGVNISGKTLNLTYATIADEGGETLSEATIAVP